MPLSKTQCPCLFIRIYKKICFFFLSLHSFPLFILSNIMSVCHKVSVSYIPWFLDTDIKCFANSRCQCAKILCEVWNCANWQRDRLLLPGLYRRRPVPGFPPSWIHWWRSDLTGWLQQCWHAGWHWDHAVQRQGRCPAPLPSDPECKEHIHFYRGHGTRWSCEWTEEEFYFPTILIKMYLYMFFNSTTCLIFSACSPSFTTDLASTHSERW